MDAAFAAMEQAAGSGADLCVLPEMWPRSYVDALRDDDGAVDWAALLDRWAAWARSLEMISVGGLPTVNGDGTVSNSLYVIGRDGAILGRYDKLHLFTFMNEDQRFRPGDDLLELELEGIRFGFQICYDLRFPEPYRMLRERGVDAFVTIAQWPTARADHWDLFLRARAVENLCYSIGVNRVGTVQHRRKEVPFGGGSAVIDPWGEAHWVGGDRVAVGFAEIDAGNVAGRRDRFPNWQDRRFAVTRKD